MAKANPVEIQKYLKGIDYPANKQSLLERAQQEGANDEVCATLNHLPDREFNTPAEVSEAVGSIE